MADLRVADAESKLGVLNRRFGVPLIDGGTVRWVSSEASNFWLSNRVCDTTTNIQSVPEQRIHQNPLCLPSRLPELIGLSRALDVILTGRIIDANEALQMGLVNRVCKTGQAYGRAMHLAKELIAHPQECLRTDRASAYHATFASKSLEQSLEHEGHEGLRIINKVHTT